MSSISRGERSAPDAAEPAADAAQQAQLDDKRRRIMAQAARAFFTRGYDATNLEEVAISSGVSKATIYRLFQDKADLFATVVLVAVDELAPPLREVLRLDLPMEAVLTRYAELYGRRMIEPVFGSRPFYEVARMILMTSLGNPQLARSCKAVFRRDLGDPLAAFMQAKIEAGELRAEDSGFLAEHFTQMLFFTNSVLIEPEAAPAPEALGGLAARVVRLFLQGASPGGAAAQVAAAPD